MIIKLDSSYGIMRINSDNITTYFREDNQLLTQINMVDGKRYLVENTPEEIDDLLIGRTGYSEENILRTYRVRYGDIMTGRFFADIPDIEAPNIDTAIILCKKYIKQHKADTDIFYNLFNGNKFNKITIIDEDDIRHEVMLSRSDIESQEV